MHFNGEKCLWAPKSPERAVWGCVRCQSPSSNTDIGNSVGNVLHRETGVKNNILSIDEIDLKEGDFIDIGQPIVNNRVFPVVVKSLIFG